MAEASAADQQHVASILALLRERTGSDFSRYRAATVQRRILNRMISVGAQSLGAYLLLLESSRDEAARLLDRMAIKVSRFYRNRASFDLLRRSVLPALAAAGAPLRVWSAGCGCGEEPYTLAMLLDEAGAAGEVLASDIDPAALAAAGRGLYAAEAAAELPAELAARYLEPAGKGRLLAGAAVRARVRFERHDLQHGALPGAPAAGFDLVSCRNLLIYLQADVRQEALGTLVRALRPGGVLFLGEAEWPAEGQAAALECISHAARLFRARAA
jgi:chemotaxis methyl-accepting protein methylase